MYDTCASVCVSVCVYYFYVYPPRAYRLYWNYEFILFILFGNILAIIYVNMFSSLLGSSY